MIWNYDGHMKRKVLWTVICLVVASVIGFVIYKHHRENYRNGEEEPSASLEERVQKAYDAKLKDGTCKKRGDALDARMEKLQHEADAKLKIGTKKDAVIRFFAENNIPVEFYGGKASGTINTTGCSPLGCGTDAVSTRLQVDVDKQGSVTSKPDVDGMYVDCP